MKIYLVVVSGGAMAGCIKKVYASRDAAERHIASQYVAEKDVGNEGLCIRESDLMEDGELPYITEWQDNAINCAASDISFYIEQETGIHCSVRRKDDPESGRRSLEFEMDERSVKELSYEKLSDIIDLMTSAPAGVDVTWTRMHHHIAEWWGKEVKKAPLSLRVEKVFYSFYEEFELSVVNKRVRKWSLDGVSLDVRIYDDGSVEHNKIVDACKWMKRSLLDVFEKHANDWKRLRSGGRVLNCSIIPNLKVYPVQDLNHSDKIALGHSDSSIMESLGNA